MPHSAPRYRIRPTGDLVSWLHVRTNPELTRAVEAAARAEGISASEFARRSLRTALSDDDGPKPPFRPARGQRPGSEPLPAEAA